MSTPRLDLRGTFLTLLEALAESRIPYAFIGAIAVLAWGRVRATTDIDLVVLSEEGWPRLLNALERRGFEVTQRIGPAESTDEIADIVMFSRPGSSAVRIDIFVAKTEFERVVIDTARETNVMDVNVRLAQPEASIIYKLLANRRKDIDDIEGIFEARRIAHDALDWDFLDHWAKEWSITDRLQPYREHYNP